MAEDPRVRQIIMNIDAVNALIKEGSDATLEFSKYCGKYLSCMGRAQELMSETSSLMTQLVEEKKQQATATSDQPTPLPDEEVQRLLDQLINNPEFASRMGRSLADNVLKSLTEQSVSDMMEQFRGLVAEVFKELKTAAPATDKSARPSTTDN